MGKLVFISDDRCPVARTAAAELVKQGYQVVLNDMGGNAVPGTEKVTLDLADFAVLDACFASFGGAFYAVIHPAPPPVQATIETASDEQWQAAFMQGAQASMQLTRAAGKHLTAMGRGKVIYLGTIHADKPMGNGFLHTMGQSATQMLCREATLDFGRSDVHCFYVQRGVIAEDMGNKNDYSHLYYSPTTRYPKQCLPETSSYNELILFLLSSGSGPLSGTDLRADEGMTMYYGHAVDEEEP
jgi:NAD(P)-dependent dehydrogenase (short-subunit alcohol dehydrogenase family)